MKKSKNVEDLAASLAVAASTPLVAPAQSAPAAPAQARRRSASGETQQMTLRPRTSLIARYVDMAADRSKQLGRTVTAQQVMLEVLERGAA